MSKNYAEKEFMEPTPVQKEQPQKLPRHQKPSTSLHSYHDENSRKVTGNLNRSGGKVSDKGDSRISKSITEKRVAESESFKHNEFDKHMKRNDRKKAISLVFGDSSNMDIITIKGPSIAIRPCTSVESIKSFNSIGECRGCAVGRLFPIGLPKLPIKHTERKENNKDEEIENFIKENFSILKVDKGPERVRLLRNGEIKKKNTVSNGSLLVDKSDKQLENILPPRRNNSHVKFSNERIFVDPVVKFNSEKEDNDHKRKKVEEKERRNVARITNEKKNRKNRKSRKDAEGNDYQRKKNKKEISISEKRSKSLTTSEKQSVRDRDNKKEWNHSNRRSRSKECKESKDEHFLRRRNRLNGGRSSSGRRTRKDESLGNNKRDRSSVRNIMKKESLSSIKQETKSKDVGKNRSKRITPRRSKERRNNLYSYLTLGFFRRKTENKDVRRKSSNYRGKKESGSRVSRSTRSSISSLGVHSLKNDEEISELKMNVISTKNSREMINRGINEKREFKSDEKRRNENELGNLRSNSESKLVRTSEMSNQHASDKTRESNEHFKFLKRILGRERRKSTTKVEKQKNGYKMDKSKKKSSIDEKRSKQRVKNIGKAEENTAKDTGKIKKKASSVMSTKSGESQNNMRKVSFFIANSLFKNVVSTPNWYMPGRNL
ncbi:hypothetical protein LSTR_LSTR001292 [Laodelphax striatellus]|uniref:Uncharacterized protein n=1 Tax=Laodelphax striatellus TaxID=195883 RepID=A0A482XBB6_LAOST|nr:hypothetical protein LSTR_LSTR001292 [Laodelphax striatellus]